MRILLLTPPTNLEEICPKFISKKGIFPGIGKEYGLVSGLWNPLELLYIASSLKASSHSVFFLESYFHSIEKIMNYIEKCSPQVVIISYSPFLSQLAKFIEIVKRSYPYIFIAMEGQHIISPEKYMKECKFLDAVLYGESEETAVELASRLEKGKSLIGLKGTVIRHKNKIFKNPPRPPPNLDKLPFPDRSLIDVRKYSPSIGFFKKLPHTTIFTSRGCPFHCSFCLVRLTKFRVRTPENVIKEIEECVEKYGIKDIMFLDETFTVPKKRAMKICDLLIQKGFDVIWGANARVDTVDRELLRKMKRAGCYRISYGIESGVQKNLNILNKGITLNQIRKAIKLTKELGIETFGHFMFGIPGESFKDGLETIKFACELNLDYATFLYFTPFQGTELYEIAKRKGRILVDTSKRAPCPKTHFFCYWNPSYVPNSMTEDELRKLQTIALKKFYLRFNYVSRRFISIKCLEDFKRNLRGFLAFSSFDKREI